MSTVAGNVFVWTGVETCQWTWLPNWHGNAAPQTDTEVVFADPDRGALDESFSGASDSVSGVAGRKQPPVPDAPPA